MNTLRIRSSPLNTRALEHLRLMFYSTRRIGDITSSMIQTQRNQKYSRILLKIWKTWMLTPVTPGKTKPPISLQAPVTNARHRKMWDDEWYPNFTLMRDTMDEADLRRVDDSTGRLGIRDENNLIKIAILDFGCDKDLASQFTEGKLAAGWKDFVAEGNVEWLDNAGHGTVVTSILLKTVKYAKVYIARVFDAKEGDSGTARRVAKASEPRMNGLSRRHL